MIHVIFNRPTAEFKVYGPDGSEAFSFEAGGDAWGNWVTGTCVPGYGYDCWCPPGHYVLGPIDDMDPPTSAEGAHQVNVNDIDNATLNRLLAAGKAEQGHDNLISIGGIMLPVGRLGLYNRSAIEQHAGGSNAPDPQALRQPLLRTYGCTRLHNEDLAQYVAWLRPLLDGNIAVYSIVGDPLALPD